MPAFVIDKAVLAEALEELGITLPVKVIRRQPPSPYIGRIRAYVWPGGERALSHFVMLLQPWAAPANANNIAWHELGHCVQYTRLGLDGFNAEYRQGVEAAGLSWQQDGRMIALTPETLPAYQAMPLEAEADAIAAAHEHKKICVRA